MKGNTKLTVPGKIHMQNYIEHMLVAKRTIKYTYTDNGANS